MINWRDESGHGRPDLDEAPAKSPCATQQSGRTRTASQPFFRRKGKEGGRRRCRLAKGIVTDLRAVRSGPLMASQFPGAQHFDPRYQYQSAKFDVDGFRIDTLKFIEPDFAQAFGNSMREFALSIGKKNFFTFGEVYDNEEQIARFIGRQATEDAIWWASTRLWTSPFFSGCPAWPKD